jgi:hypothetical protein
MLERVTALIKILAAPPLNNRAPIKNNLITLYVRTAYLDFILIRNDSL